MTRAGILAHNGGKKELTVEAGEDESPVIVYGTVKLEHYEVSILGAAGASSLLGWLENNGYKVNPAAGKVLDAYIRENWTFVAVKLNPSENRSYQNEFLPPLTISFRHDRLVFPLRISSVSTAETVRITLYVICESTVSSANLPTTTLEYRKSIPSWLHHEAYIEDCIRQTAGSERPGLAVLWQGKYPASTDFQEILGELMKKPFPSGVNTYLTRLETQMGPSAMNEDIELVCEPAPRSFRVDITISEELGATPWKVPGLSGVRQIAAGQVHTSVLKKDGTVWAWGQNEYGQIGDGTTTYRSQPVEVEGVSGMIAIATSGIHTAALGKDGTVWTWGGNWYGQLGDGSTTDRLTPVQVRGPSGVAAIGAGWRRSAALKADGTLWGWGSYW